MRRVPSCDRREEILLVLVGDRLQELPHRLRAEVIPTTCVRLMVTYRSLAADSTSVDMRYIVSTDGGTTLGRERKLGPPGDLEFAVMATDNFHPTLLKFLGDYMGVAMSASEAHAVWCRPSRPPGGSTLPQHQTTWSATIRR